MWTLSLCHSLAQAIFLILSRFFLKVTCHFITLQKFFQGCVKTLHDLELIKADAHIFEITWRRYNSTADISADATADATTDATADSTADGTGNCSIHFYKNGILSVFPGNTDRQTAVLKWLIKGWYISELNSMSSNQFWLLARGRTITSFLQKGAYYSEGRTNQGSL